MLLALKSQWTQFNIPPPCSNNIHYFSDEQLYWDKSSTKEKKAKGPDDEIVTYFHHMSLQTQQQDSRLPISFSSDQWSQWHNLPTPVLSSDIQVYLHFCKPHLYDPQMEWISHRTYAAIIIQRHFYTMF